MVEGEFIRITDVSGETITIVSNAPRVERSRWWRVRLWTAKRISALAYLVWPKDKDDYEQGEHHAG